MQVGGALEIGGGYGFKFLHYAKPPIQSRQLQEPECRGYGQGKALGKARPKGSQQQEGQVLGVDATRQVLITQDAKVGPERGDEGGWV